MQKKVIFSTLFDTQNAVDFGGFWALLALFEASPETNTLGPKRVKNGPKSTFFGLFWLELRIID